MKCITCSPVRSNNRNLTHIIEYKQNFGLQSTYELVEKGKKLGREVVTTCKRDVAVSIRIPKGARGVQFARFKGKAHENEDADRDMKGRERVNAIFNLLTALLKDN